MSILLKDVVLDGATVSIRLDRNGISAVAPELPPLPEDAEVFSGENRFAALPPFPEPLPFPELPPFPEPLPPFPSFPGTFPSLKRRGSGRVESRLY